MQNCSQPLPPLSLYIHIPWCVKKCPYCDFNSHASGEKVPEDSYVVTLLEDLKNDLKFVQNRPLQSIFFGGGTPSLFSSTSIKKILFEIEKNILFSDSIEVTLEANPGTFEQQKFIGYRQAGVNRLSIGIQSFDDKKLQALGRIHSANEAASAVNSARKSGFNNFNLDLMHGLPDQSTEQALSDLQQAIDLQPAHISWYQLTIEPNTAFYNKPPTLPIENILDGIQQQGQQLLAANGYQQYEVSAYAKTGSESQHNLNYWQFGDYLGIGAGAHSKITLPKEQQILRISKTRQPTSYMARKSDFLASKKLIEKSELPLEFLMNALRLNQGVPLDFFQQRTGLNLEEISTAWQELESLGMVEGLNDRVSTTKKGHQFLNSVLSYFL